VVAARGTAKARRPVPAAKPEVEVRQRLLEAGQRVFADMGYAGARVEDIIDAANTSRATFYRYFSSKNELFTELSRLCFEEMRGTTRAVASITPGTDAREQLIEVMKAWRDLFDRHGGVIRAWFERGAVPDSPISREAAKAFDRLFEELLGPILAADTGSRVPPEVQAALLFILMERSYYFVTSRHSHMNPDRLAPTLATMIERSYLGGAAPAPGRRLRTAAD
jgi:AcrR family transcriptional regulator